MLTFNSEKARNDFSEIANRIKESNDALFNNISIVEVSKHGLKAMQTNEVKNAYRKNVSNKKEAKEAEILISSAERLSKYGVDILIQQSIVSTYSILEAIADDVAKFIFPYSKSLSQG